jgi:lysine N6-hydroxylase
VTHIHGLLGIGLGPFNLGLACLADPIDDLDAVFLDAADGFSWHPGMMLPDATLQVPFMADLVTLADPTSRFSYLAFLKDVGRLHPFYIRESFYPLRREYDDYCRWAAERLDSLRWGERVVAVEHDGEAYVVRSATGRTWRARNLVLGTGTAPRLPFDVDGPALHSADYLARKADLVAGGSVTVVGSGQSAAEVYADLLAEQEAHGFELTWVTRSPRFFPMEYTKLTLEMTSPEWSSYFQGLPTPRRAEVQRGQAALSKGISHETINAIYDELYRRAATGGVATTLLTATEVAAAHWDGRAYALDLRHTEQGTTGRLRTDHLVLATGYTPRVPHFLDPVRDRIRWDEHGRFRASPTFAVDHAGSEVFVQNAEEHTHGFVAPDLGMGAMRSSVILAQVLGREPYAVEKRIAFQEWGIPDRFRHPLVEEGASA